MSRKHIAEGESLDLLLDTICNTFGGILFISILIVVLINTTSPDTETTQPDPAAEAQQRELEQQARRSEEEVARLRDLHEMLLSATGNILDPSVDEALTEMQDLQDMIRGLETQITVTADANAEGEGQVNAQEQLLQAKEELAKAKTELEQERADRMRTMGLPRQRSSSRTEVALLLKEGCLCVYQEVDAQGDLIPVTGQWSEIPIENGLGLKPRPEGGLLLNDTDSARSAVSELVQQYDKEKHAFTICIWPDSFDAARILLSAIDENDYGYNLFPMDEKEEAVPLGNSNSELIIMGG